jgi:hypothetical protein
MAASEWIIIILQVFLYATPFWFFAATSRFSTFLWAIQAVFTIVLWVWFAVMARESALMGNGVNIAAGWIMFIGPALTAAASLLLQRITEQ